MSKKIAVLILIALTNLSSIGCQYFVNPRAIFIEKFEGWGTSMAWWADLLGAMPNDVVEEITNALFSKDRLNLNIVRYTIGGSTPNTFPCGPFRDGGATESFKDGPNLDFDWNRDARQRRILQIARSYSVDTFEAFSNSPPQWLTISGCSKGNPQGPPLYINFDSINATSYAYYATEVIKYFHETQNITFTSYAPFNEPFGDDGRGWWNGPGTGQEGCHMDRQTMVDVITAVHQELLRKNMTYVKISVADETQINTEIASQAYFKDAGITHLYTKVNTHGYSDNGSRRRDLLYMMSQREGHTLWMDEVGWNRGSSPTNMTQGLQISKRIIWDLREMLPTAWIYWQVMEDVGVWGLVEVPFGNPNRESIQYNSGFFSMMQFSKYIRKGYAIIHISDDNSLAAYNDQDETLVIVIVNEDFNEIVKTFDLSQFCQLGVISATRTSPSEQHYEISSPPIIEKSLTYATPARSVTTFVIFNAKLDSNQPANFIQNGNFEIINELTALPDHWTLFFGTNGGANDDYTWKGNYSGFITTTQDIDMSLNQRIIIPTGGSTSKFHLSARCATSGDFSKVGIKVNDLQGPEEIIQPRAGYKIYGLFFEASPGDIIDVYLYSAKSNADSYIDEVVMSKGVPSNEMCNNSNGSSNNFQNTIAVTVCLVVAFVTNEIKQFLY